MKLTFLGAVGTVTGSKYLLSFDDKHILIDCGLFQGVKELRLRNWSRLPIHPQDIDAIILTHAHLDHTGYIPLLVKQGFSGKIYCTDGTKDLCSVLLPDSGHLQEEEAYQANKYGFSKHKPALPLYTYDEALYSLKSFVSMPYNVIETLFNDFQFEFIPAGHIIGSAFVKIQFKDISILFSGDIGRPNDKVMKPPTIIQNTDYLILESTYGDRLHEKGHPKDYLKMTINKTIARGGNVIIPSFAVGRSQSLLYYIHLLKEEKSIPDVPVYLDSPMAINATHILLKHQENLRLNQEECHKIGEVATYINTPEESKALDEDKSPKIIISASGMATGGRVLYHLATYAPDPHTTILFAGYQALGTRGARMMNKEQEVKIHGEMIPMNAEIEALSNFSAHADYQEILDWLGHFTSAPKKIFITHGEPNSAKSLKEKITQRFAWNCIIPHYRQQEFLT